VETKKSGKKRLYRLLVLSLLLQKK